VEIAALTKAFRASTGRQNYCAIGSVKTNIGHLDAAAGVAGLIKTVLALKHQQLPPSLHYEQANPNIEFAGSPFYVNGKLQEWERGEERRRAGVSSFGVGGTNAHVIVEEWEEESKGSAGREWEVVVMSGKDEQGLEEVRGQLVEYLKKEESAGLEEVSYTLKVGRKGLEERVAVIGRSKVEVIDALASGDEGRMYRGKAAGEGRPVVFMFPGGGSQYAGMGEGIYRSEKLFREQVDLCAEILEPHLGYDLRSYLYPTEARKEVVSELIKETSVALPALFVVEYALAKLWIAWGVHPEGMIGHSLGEYVAACLAGVFSLEDALSLVVLRGRLLERLPGGVMFSLPLSSVEVLPLTDERLSIAAINGPDQCVISGPINAMEGLASTLTARNIEFRRLQINTASHSPMVAPILQEFTASVAKLRLQAPVIPYLSNVTGTWATEAVTDPNYWARHLRETVRFGEGVSELMADPDRVLLEVGPGHTLSTLARLQKNKSLQQIVLSSMRHPYDKQPDMGFLLTALGRLWVGGVEVDWEGYYQGQKRRRVALPTYPFRRQRYWIEAGEGHRAKPQAAATGKRADVGEWFYVPIWKSASAPAAPDAERAGRWLIFEDEEGIGAGLARRREAAGGEVIRVRGGARYAKLGEGDYEIDIQRQEDYAAVIREMRSAGKPVAEVVHLLGVGKLEGEGEAKFRAGARRGYYSVLKLMQGLMQELEEGEEVGVSVVTSGMQEVESWEEGEAEKAVVVGCSRVMRQEREGVRSRSIDFVMRGEEGEARRIVEQLEKEIEGGKEEEVAYRGAKRWVKSYEQVKLEGKGERELRLNGVYMITGGLGRIGLMLAGYLAKEFKARIILVGRSEFPKVNRWEEWIKEKGEEEEISKKIKKLQEMQKEGGEVEIKRADVSNEEAMQRVVEEVYEQYGRIDGVIHAAGAAGEKVVRLIADLDGEISESQFRAKVYGAYVLERVLQGRQIDFCLLFSSNASILGGIGLLGYSAANLFMDAFAANGCKRDGNDWISANWDGWLVGDEAGLSGAFKTSLDQFAMTPAESLEAFKRVVTQAKGGQVIVSTGNLFDRLDLWVKQKDSRQAQDSAPDAARAVHPRPALKIDYVPPVDEVQQAIAKI
jgi:phthiocerol/phenolphthiocerol synthesis type-I polyketide synthase E